MFTGIIEATGAVVSFKPGPKSSELVLAAPRISRGLRVGSSLAVNGACLTVVGARAGRCRFDVLNETLRCTNLGALRPGSLVNLERPLRASARLDGHFVLGHVDATGTVRRYEQSGADYVLDIKAPATVMRYVLYKGSVAVDGISLTIAETKANWFRIWIIPHTHAVTNLRAKKTGDPVNLEVDILGKYVEKFIKRGRG